MVGHVALPAIRPSATEIMRTPDQMDRAPSQQRVDERSPQMRAPARSLPPCRRWSIARQRGFGVAASPWKVHRESAVWRGSSNDAFNDRGSRRRSNARPISATAKASTAPRKPAVPTVTISQPPSIGNPKTPRK